MSLEDGKTRKNKISDIHWVPAMCQKFQKNSTYMNKCSLYKHCSRGIFALPGEETAFHGGCSSKTAEQLKRRERIGMEACLTPQNSYVIPAAHSP